MCMHPSQSLVVQILSIFERNDLEVSIVCEDVEVKVFIYLYTHSFVFVFEKLGISDCGATVVSIASGALMIASPMP